MHNRWVYAGKTHDIPWNYRAIIKETSGWVLEEECHSRKVSDLLPLIEAGLKSIKEKKGPTSNLTKIYDKEMLETVQFFYESLLIEFKKYPYTELYGYSTNKDKEPAS